MIATREPPAQAARESTDRQIARVEESVVRLESLTRLLSDEVRRLRDTMRPGGRDDHTS